MKILFISGLYPHEYIDKYSQLSSFGIQNAPNVFQWSVVDGLYSNSVNFEVVTLPFLPAYPYKYKQMYTLSSNVIHKGEIIGKMLSYCSFFAVKKISIRRRLENYIYKWIKQNKNEDQLVLLIYTPYSPFIEAARNVKKKFPNVKSVSIVTDLVDDMMNFADNHRNLLKSIQTNLEISKTKKLYKYIDKFVLLSKYMEEKIPEAKDNNIVIEGLCARREFNVINKSKNRTILYAGTLDEFSGVADLVNAFLKIKNPDYRMIICGKGHLTPMIIDAAKKDSRIIYRGLVSRDEVLKLQQNATFLINPRKPDNQITRYSFPSKTMEYLSSGTPMIGYKLDGIPSEYYNYYYTIDDLSEEAMITTIENVMSLPQSVLDKKARDAFEFIDNNKTAEKQVKRILDFISKN